MVKSVKNRSLSLHRLYDEFCIATMMLTRLPVPSITRSVPALNEAMWAFPLIGLIVSAGAASIGSLALYCGLPPLIACCLTLAAAAILTGALHEDGLADMADGFGAGGTAARISAIMKDSQIGSYGALSLILIVIMRVSVLTELTYSALGFGICFILASMFGRGMAVILCSAYPVSSHASLGRAAAAPPRPALITSILFWLIPLWLIAGSAGLIAACLGGALVLWIGRTATAKLGGLTGDIIGSAILLSETAFLIGLVGIFA